MKKLFAFLMLVGILTFTHTNYLVAQDEDTTDVTEEGTTEGETEEGDSAAAETPEEPQEAEVSESDVEEVEVETVSTHQYIKEKFIEGGWGFMTTVLICLILGLAVSIERIITLSLATTNAKKLITKVEDALKSGGVEEAKNVCRNTRGPVASIFMQGLMRVSEGIDMVEKSVVAYGSVEMSKLERGIVWISLFIALAPMLGFMGTVIGMIDAFDKIQAAGDVSPSLVAGGIKVALITTVSGLIVAVILQVFYNYIVSKVDSIVSQMEEASIALVDVLVENNVANETTS